MENEDRENTLTIFGITGFTGVLLVRYLEHLVSSGRFNPQNRICFAGRNVEAMKKLCAKLSPIKPSYCFADVKKEDSIYHMASNTRVLLTLVGPYEAFGGEVVIKACVSMNTHYVDITGEGKWISLMRSRYHALAVGNGVCIVPFAGQDCVPADLTAWFTTSQVHPSEFEESHATLETCVKLPGKGAQLSNGTFKTIINQEGLDFNQYPEPAVDFERRLNSSVALQKDVPPSFGGPLAIFPNRLFPDGRVVLDSHQALNLGGRFENTHSFVFPNRVTAMATQMGIGMLPYLLKVPFVRQFMNNISESGSSFKPLSNGGQPVAYSVYGILNMFPLLGDKKSTIAQETIVTKVDLDRDPYEVTAICAFQIALALCDKPRDEIKVGFQTPVCAIGGQELLERCFECFRIQMISRL